VNDSRQSKAISSSQEEEEERDERQFSNFASPCSVHLKKARGGKNLLADKISTPTNFKKVLIFILCGKLLQNYWLLARGQQNYLTIEMNLVTIVQLAVELASTVESTNCESKIRNESDACNIPQHRTSESPRVDKELVVGCAGSPL
jgi:hypothetical protein